MKAHLVLIGAPGSGKGTQAKKLVQDYGYCHLSTGDLLRDEMKKGTDLGAQVESVIKSGKLVDNTLMMKLLKANLDLEKKSYIFDGYPRNLEQARALDDEILGGSNFKVISFDLELKVLLERLTNRRICKSCGAIFNLISKAPKEEGVCDECQGELYQRDDDKEEVIRDRLDVFSQAISPMLDFYQKKNVLQRIDASLDSAQVEKGLKEIVEAS